MNDPSKTVRDEFAAFVEYSVRAAQMAVYQLLGLNKTPPPVYKGQAEPEVLVHAINTLLT